MSSARFPTIDGTFQKTNIRLDGILHELPCDHRECTDHASGAILHTFRNYLTIDEAVHLAAQFPQLIRGMYYKGWKQTLSLT
jgi:uncharacterized protein (DUF2267 family)